MQVGPNMDNIESLKGHKGVIIHGRLFEILGCRLLVLRLAVQIGERSSCFKEGGALLKDLFLWGIGGVNQGTPPGALRPASFQMLGSKGRLHSRPSAL